MTNPVGTAEQREELRQETKLTAGGISHVSGLSPLATLALDGLDIAQEMAEHIASLIEKQLQAGQPCSCCENLMLRWDKWQANPDPDA